MVVCMSKFCAENLRENVKLGQKVNWCLPLLATICQRSTFFQARDCNSEYSTHSDPVPVWKRSTMRYDRV